MMAAEASYARTQALLATIGEALDGTADASATVSFRGEGALPSRFAVTDLAGATIAGAAAALADLIAVGAGRAPAVVVDRRLASFWFAMSIRPIGWSLPPAWDPIAGDYAARNGWIRLHTNAPHHRAAAERVLGAQPDRTAMSQAVAGWAKAELEEAVIAQGGCASEMFTLAEWAAHPQGRAVAAEPLAYVETVAAHRPNWPVDPARPLAGIRVLDLTRVLAGPVATRFLAGYGAEVLRLDPPAWDEPSLAPEVTLGKRCARLDLTTNEGRRIFENLLAGADVLLHGYRPGALDALGFDVARRRSIAPGLVDVCLDAYGWSGPWAGRRGFDSLVQMSTGIAAAGMAAIGADKPVPLPVQALDHATGYLLAMTVLRGLRDRMTDGVALTARLSLARTAKVLTDFGFAAGQPPLAAESEANLASFVEATAWGPARRLLPPVFVEGAPMAWSLPAGPIGSAAPAWA